MSRPYRALGSKGHGVIKTLRPCLPSMVRKTKTGMTNPVTQDVCVCVCASPAARLFLLTRAVLFINGPQEEVGALRSADLPRRREEMSVCLSLKGQSVNMT